MDNQEYLNQISTQVAPAKSSSGIGGILKSKFVLVGVIGVVGLILLAILGMVLSSGKTDMKTNLLRLRLHADYTIELIDKYQPNIKSSNLRSSGASLKTILLSTSSEVANYMTDKYGENSDKSSKDLEEQMKTEQDELDSDLFEAKINGILDRVFAYKMAFEITQFENEETAIYNSAKDDELKSILDHSYDSLKILYNEFNDFSEGK